MNLLNVPVALTRRVRDLETTGAPDKRDEPRHLGFLEEHHSQRTGLCANDRHMCFPFPQALLIGYKIWNNAVKTWPLSNFTNSV